MPYRICKSFEVESGHMLSKHPEKCRFPHGHTRKVELTLEAEELDQNDMVCDFKVIKTLLWEFLETLDHAMCINTEDPGYAALKAAYGERVISFEKVDPTTEVMAKSIYDYFQQKFLEYQQTSALRFPLQPGVRLVQVRLWETSSSWAEYAERGNRFSKI